MNDQLQDLLIPPKQAEPSLLLWLGLILLVCLSGLGLWGWNKYHKQAHIIAQNKLKHLLKQSNITSEESQKTALEIASILCKGLGVNRLDQFQANDSQEWQTFRQRLNTACYSVCNDKTDIQTLINEAGNWLNRVNRVNH